MKGKLIIVAVLCTALLTLTGCSQIAFFQPTPTLTPTQTITPTLEPTITPTPTPSGEWISSSDGFITFQGVPGFITVQQGNLIASLSPNADLATGPVFAILHGSLEEMGLGSDLNEVAMNLITDSQFEYSTTTSSTLLGNNTFVVDYTTTINDTALTGQMTLFCTNETTLVIFIATAPTDNWLDLQIYLESTLSSIQLTQ